MDSFGFSLTGGGILAPPLLLTCKGDFITPGWIIPGGDSALEPERTGSSVPEHMRDIFPQIRQKKLNLFSHLSDSLEMAERTRERCCC